MVLTLGIDVGIINLAACLADVSPGEPPRVIDCINFRIGNPKDSINDLLKTLVHSIAQRADTMEPSALRRVVVEQQLGKTATKNYALSAALLCYYESLSFRRGGEISVTSVNPRKKFKLLAQMDDVRCLDIIRDDLRTARGPALKKLAIKAADLLAEHWQCTVFIDKTRNMKKRDDISDSYLYSILDKV